MAEEAKSQDGTITGAATDLAAILNAEVEDAQPADAIPEKAEKAEEATPVAEEEAEEAEPEASDEAEVEEEAPETPEEPSEEVEDKWLLTVGDEERELSADDIISALDSKTTLENELATVREQVERERQELQRHAESIEQARQAYLERLNELSMQEAPRPRMEDFDGDFEAYTIAKDSWESQREMTQQVRAEQQQEYERQQALDYQRWQNHLAEQAHQLKAKAPDLASEDALTGLRSYLVDTYGFEPNQVNALADHRYTIIADKARKYDALQSKKSVVQKKVAQKPPVRPGSPETKSDRDQESRAAHLKKLRRTGSHRDAIPIFKELLGE